MAEDPLDAIRDQLAHFVVGLVERVEGAGSRVLGSGVLVSIIRRHVDHSAARGPSSVVYTRYAVPIRFREDCVDPIGQCGLGVG